MPAPFGGGVPGTKGPGSPVKSFTEALPGARATLAAISTLTETWDAFDPQKWFFTNANTSGQMSVSGGFLTLSNGTGGAGSAFNNDAYVPSDQSFDLTGSAIVIRAPVLSSPASGTFEVGLVLNLPTSQTPYGNNGLVMTVTRSAGVADAFFRSVNIANSFVIADNSGTFSATTDYWWRIRESGGTIFWDTAPDASGVPGTWVNRTTFATASFTPGIRQLQVRHYYRLSADAPSVGAASAQFDVVNPVATSAFSLSATDGADTLAASVDPLAGWSLAQTDAADSLVSSVAPLVRVSSASTDGADSLAASVSPLVGVALATTDGADTASAQLAPLVGISAATADGADAFASSLSPQTSMSASPADGSDSIASSLAPLAGLTSTTTDGPDALAASIDTLPTTADFSLAATDGADSLASSIEPTADFATAATDGADTLAATLSTPLVPVDFTLSVTNGPDTLEASIAQPVEVPAGGSMRYVYDPGPQRANKVDDSAEVEELFSLAFSLIVSGALDVR